MIGILNGGNTREWENIPRAFLDYRTCCTKNQHDLRGIVMNSMRYFSPFLGSVSDAICVHYYRRKTEKAYISWVKRFIYFHHKQHPREMRSQEVTAFLTYLAVDRNVALSTKNEDRVPLNVIDECV